MSIASFFEGFATGIFCVFMLSALAARTIVKHKEYYLPKMMNLVREVMVKRANNANRQKARTDSRA